MRYYIRFGQLPRGGKSKNYAPPSIYEAYGLPAERVHAGVSVFNAEWSEAAQRWVIFEDSGIAASLAAVWDQNRPMYLLTGRRSPHEGADGEPLLVAKTIRKVRKLTKADVLPGGWSGYFSVDEGRSRLRELNADDEVAMAMLRVLMTAELGARARNLGMNAYSRTYDKLQDWLKTADSATAEKWTKLMTKAKANEGKSLKPTKPSSAAISGAVNSSIVAHLDAVVEELHALIIPASTLLPLEEAAAILSAADDEEEEEDAEEEEEEDTSVPERDFNGDISLKSIRVLLLQAIDDIIIAGGELFGEEDVAIDDIDVEGFAEGVHDGSVVFSEAAWQALYGALAKHLRRGIKFVKDEEERIDESTVSYKKRLNRIAASLWTERGTAKKLYSMNVEVEDGGDFQKVLEERKDLSYDIANDIYASLNRNNSLRNAAHALEQAINNAAHDAIESVRVTDADYEHSSDRGLEHDTVVYRYAGSNDTISGASSRGMYVADLAPANLAEESKELGHCLGNRKHGHPQLLEKGITKIYSIRTMSGHSKFSIEQFEKDHEGTASGTISEIKGQSNRLPGFEPGSATLTKNDEVKLVVEFLMKHLGLTPSQIEGTDDIRGGVKAMQAMGLDPFSPPPKKAERPKRDPRGLQAAARMVMADFNRPFAAR